MTTQAFRRILYRFEFLVSLTNLALVAGVLMPYKKKTAQTRVVTAATLAVDNLEHVLVTAQDQGTHDQATHDQATHAQATHDQGTQDQGTQDQGPQQQDAPDQHARAQGPLDHAPHDHAQDSQEHGPQKIKLVQEEPAPKSAQPSAANQTSVHTLADAEARRNLPRFADYEILGVITKDGLSTTYVAKRDGVDGFLSLRVFNQRGRTDAQVRQIQKAAKAASELTHPNVVVVYESNIAEDGSPYVVTELAEGADLEQILVVAKRLDITRFLGIFTQVGEALVEAHSRQLIHGNLSPHKILLANNDDQVDLVKLIDFGMPPDPVQNAFYMSPEQSLDRARLEARTDIYALGCIMYEMLVGTPPFVGHSKSQASLNYLHELANQYSPTSPEHNALKLLDCIITKCLQTKPSKRFSSMRELMNALRLVNDCICNGDQKKLPPKAEKLLLFRFLDIFDKKIVACLFIYFTLGLCSAKYLAEVQLQKYIDQAQLAMQASNLDDAQSNWKAAIALSGFTNKPPSLQADLHWELGDTYRELAAQAALTNTRGSANDLALDAIKEYKAAQKYYEKRPNFRSYSLALSANITNSWLSIKEKDQIASAERAEFQKAHSLFASKNYPACINVCDSFLQGQCSDSIANLATKACIEAAKHANPQQTLFYLSRAEYYPSRKYHNYNDNNLQGQFLDAMRNAHMAPTEANIREGITRPAIEKGDLETAIGSLRFASSMDGSLAVTLNDYVYLRESAIKLLNEDSAHNKEAIESTKQVLKILEEAKGEHSPSRSSALRQLANCYARTGQNKLAMETYEKLFRSAPILSDNLQTEALIYADLLKNSGHAGKAVKFLEHELTYDDGQKKMYQGLYLRLIQAYWDNGLKNDAHEATYEVASEVDPIALSDARELTKYQSSAVHDSNSDEFAALAIAPPESGHIKQIRGTRETFVPGNDAVPVVVESKHKDETTRSGASPGESLF